MPIFFHAGACSFIFSTKCCRNLGDVLLAGGSVELFGKKRKKERKEPKTTGEKNIRIMGGELSWLQRRMRLFCVTSNIRNLGILILFILIGA